MTTDPERTPATSPGPVPEQTPPAVAVDPVREAALGRIAQTPVPPRTGMKLVSAAEAEVIRARQQAALSAQPSSQAVRKPAGQVARRPANAAPTGTPINVNVTTNAGAGNEAKPPEATPPPTVSHRNRNLGVGILTTGVTAALGIAFLPQINAGVGNIFKSDKSPARSTAAEQVAPSKAGTIPLAPAITGSASPSPTAFSPSLLQVTDIPSTELFKATLPTDAMKGLTIPITETMTLKIGKTPMKYTIKGYGAILTMISGGDISLDVGAPANSQALALSSNSASIGSSQVVESPSKAPAQLHLDGLQVGIARMTTPANIDATGVTYQDAKGVSHVQPINEGMRASIEKQIIGSQAEHTTGQVPALIMAAKVAFVRILQKTYGAAITAGETQFLTAYEAAMVTAQSINPHLVTTASDKSTPDLLKAAQAADPKLMDTPSTVFALETSVANVSPTTVSLASVPYKIALPNQAAAGAPTTSPAPSSSSSGK